MVMSDESSSDMKILIEQNQVSEHARKLLNFVEKQYVQLAKLYQIGTRPSVKVMIIVKRYELLFMNLRCVVRKRDIQGHQKPRLSFV